MRGCTISQKHSGGRKGKRRTAAKRRNIIRDCLDKAIADFREENEMFEVAVISIETLASYSPVTSNGFRNWNPQHFLSRNYESVEYIRQQGLEVEWEEYIEERKQERKQKAEEKENGN